MEYGGKGNVNPRLKQSRAEECDGRDDSITITIPPLGISIFTCTQLLPAKTTKKTGTQTKTASKRQVRKIENIEKEDTDAKEAVKKPASKASRAAADAPVKKEAVKAVTAKAEAEKPDVPKNKDTKKKTSKKTKRKK